MAVLHLLLLDGCGIVAPVVRSPLVQVALIELRAVVQGAEASLTLYSKHRSQPQARTPAHGWTFVHSLVHVLSDVAVVLGPVSLHG